jgi:hypothetical protein
MMPVTMTLMVFGRFDPVAFVFNLPYGVTGTPWRQYVIWVVFAATFWVAFLTTL